MGRSVFNMNTWDKFHEPLFEHEGFFKVIEAGAGMSRILQHVESGIPFLTMSAYRYTLSKNENLERNEQLLKDFKSYQLGAIKMIGHWVEKGVDSTENSFFVIGKTFTGETITPEKMEEIASTLCKKWEQDAVIFSDGQTVYLLYSTGNKVPLGNHVGIRKEDIEGGFSTIKKKRFVFESVWFTDVKNSAVAMGLTACGLKLFSWNK